MTQENKDLLFKDLCARLPYGVKCKYYDCCEGDYYEGTICGIEPKEYIQINGVCIYIEEVKLYLLPMSSMTEEEFTKLKEYSGLKYNQLDLASFQNDTYKCLDFYLSEVPSYVVIKVFDWLNRYHFDYRGLIEKSLALDATNLNVY